MDFIEREDEGFATQLHEHGQALDTHGATVGLSTGEVDEAKADAKYFRYVLDVQHQGQSFGLELTDFKNLLRKGSGSQILPALPVFPGAPTPVPAAVLAKIEERFRQRAKKAKASPAYTTGIGQALKIELPDSIFDPDSGTPVLKLKASVAGHPHFSWLKGRWQALEIHKMVLKTPAAGAPVPPVPVDDPRFVKLERVFGHEYIDPSALPEPGTSEIWLYKAIYIFKDKQAGSWSAIITVPVGAV